MARYKVGVVIPAFNEEGTIQSVINEVNSYGTVIVVNDGSEDGTAAIAREAGATVVTHAKNLGYDAALNSGFEQAAALKCDVIITFDGDGQHSASNIKQFLKAIEGGADVVLGVRHKTARLAEVIFSSIASKCWGIHDPLSGMKAYRLEVYESLGHFDEYRSIGTELSIYAAKQGYQIDQIPFEVNRRSDSPRLGSAISANLKILRALVLGILRWR